MNDADLIEHLKKIKCTSCQAAAERLQELSDEQSERCENGNCYHVDDVYHEGCDGMFCVHGWCQDCGASSACSDGD